ALNHARSSAAISTSYYGAQRRICSDALIGQRIFTPHSNTRKRLRHAEIWSDLRPITHAYRHGAAPATSAHPYWRHSHAGRRLFKQFRGWRTHDDKRNHIRRVRRP